MSTTAEEREEEKADAYALNCKLEAPSFIRYDWGRAVRGAYLEGSRDTKRQMLAGISEAREKLEHAVASTGTSTLHWKLTMEALAILERLAEGKSK